MTQHKEPICRRAVVTMPVAAPKEKSLVAKAVRQIVHVFTPEELAEDEAKRLQNLKQAKKNEPHAQQVRKSASFTTPNGRSVTALTPESVLKNGDIVGLNKHGEKIYVKHG